MNEKQNAKLDFLIELGWEVFIIDDFPHEMTKAFLAVNETAGAQMFLAIREDGTHKFYRNFKTQEEG